MPVPFSFLKKESTMKISTKCMLLWVSAISLPALAQDEASGFDNFLLSSPSIVSPSQYYQVKAGRFEALAGVLSGTFETKPVTTDIDFSSQTLTAGYAQALSNQIVLGADARFVNNSVDFGGSESESSDTEITPKLAFSISPIFSLGASINIHSGDEEPIVGSTESYSYNTFTVGGTLHQDAWETTLTLTTANKDDEKASANSAQTISLHGRYKIMPVLALGVLFEEADYPGIEQTGEILEKEASYSVILESAISDNSRVEVAFKSITHNLGENGSDATLIFLGGGFNLAPKFELGGQLQFISGESDSSRSSLNGYALTLVWVN
jgi:hypothetical protein